jgi:hypothetical protein
VLTGSNATAAPPPRSPPRGQELDEILEKLGEVAVRWQTEDRADKKNELKAA